MEYEKYVFTPLCLSGSILSDGLPGSSGISGVEADAHRLVPEGRFLSKSLWINAAKHSQRKSLLQQWLKERL